MQIICAKNQGYKWCCAEESYFRGYIQLEDGRVLRGEAAIRYFIESKDFDDFGQKLKVIYGVFSAIIIKENELWAAVDIARSMPLYYSTKVGVVSDVPEMIMSVEKKTYSEANPIRLLEMLECFYTAYDKTVFDDLKQLCAGTCIRIYGDLVETRHYYNHIKRITKTDRTHAIKRLHNITDNMIYRLKEVVGDRTIVLSLSGGHDSRYLACSLKDKGINSVVCFSYGKKGSDEVRMSAVIAKALGYEWHWVEYTDNMVKELLGATASRFMEYSGSLDSISYLQNYLAIRELKKKQLIPSPTDCVFITGLCNDMPTGQYVPSLRELNSYSLDINGAVDFLFDNRFFRLPVKKEIEKQFKREIRESLSAKGISITGYQSFIQAIDSEITDYDHTRRFLKMNEAHDYFNYEWLIPCWDKELLNFWYQLPVKYRLQQNLYKEYIRKHLTSKYGIPFEIVAASYGTNKALLSFKRNIGAGLVKITYPLGIPLRRGADINNFAPLEVELYKRIRNKKMIDLKYAGMMYLLAVFELENKYGTNWYERIERFKK